MSIFFSWTFKSRLMTDSWLNHNFEISYYLFHSLDYLCLLLLIPTRAARIHSDYNSKECSQQCTTNTDPDHDQRNTTHHQTTARRWMGSFRKIRCIGFKTYESHSLSWIPKLYHALKYIPISTTHTYLHWFLILDNCLRIKSELDDLMYIVYVVDDIVHIIRSLS